MQNIAGPMLIGRYLSLTDVLGFSFLNPSGEEIPISCDSQKKEGKEEEEEKEGNGKEGKKNPGTGEKENPGSSKYKLRGVVVHSGQASGGHYYSFIQLK